LTSPFDGLTAIVLALAVILSAIVSLATAAARRQSVADGKATVQDLCELTGILDPKELQDVFGPPDIGRVWRNVSLDQVLAERRPLGQLISGETVDWLCMAVAVLSFLTDNWIIGLSLALAVGAQTTGWVLSARLPK
ncbi:MAG: hypothetical protein AAGJ50_03295, partial [Pseudomonadota bacterium]